LYVQSFVFFKVVFHSLEEIIMRTNLINKQSGQGMTEYIVIVALVAVAAIGVYQFFGQTIRQQTTGIAQEVAGKSATTAITAAGTAADAASTAANQSKGLSSYSNDDTRGK
jgi:Flp pilus assembly pilin Flp